VQLRWYQSEACAAAWEYLCGQAGNPVIVLPTGAGKSLVIAELCRKAVEDFQGRVIVVAHRKELLEQNAAKIRALVKHPVGIFSAGLQRYQIDEDIVVAGIQSIYKKAHTLGNRHLVLIDEVHLVPRSGEGMYRTFLNELRAVNPKLRSIGLTATPFRTGEGALCRVDGLFQKVCYDAPIAKLIEEGFLCPVTNQIAEHEQNTKLLHMRGGEFIPSEVERLFSGKAAVVPACREIAQKTAARHSVLLFCSGVDHADQVAGEIQRFTGERCGLVTGNTPPLERAATLSQFKNQELRFLCNVDVLTTGFDAPCVDAIAILRATASPGLFAQICGRGLRTHETKTNCLVLDFGENIKRHGPIDALDYGRDRQSSGLGGGEAPTKMCPNCEEQLAIGVTQCECGFKFPDREPKHNASSDDASTVLATPETWQVSESSWSKHVKHKDPDAPPTLRIDHLCVPIGGTMIEVISEWVCLEHSGFARQKAHRWWKMHSLSDVPSTVEEALYLRQCGATVCPYQITTIKEGRFKRITARKIEELPTQWREAPATEDFENARNMVQDADGDWVEELPF
jgi:DNA repair protein RadD